MRRGTNKRGVHLMTRHGILCLKPRALRTTRKKGDVTCQGCLDALNEIGYEINDDFLKGWRAAFTFAQDTHDARSHPGPTSRARWMGNAKTLIRRGLGCSEIRAMLFFCAAPVTTVSPYETAKLWEARAEMVAMYLTSGAGKSMWEGQLRSEFWAEVDKNIQHERERGRA